MTESSLQSDRRRFTRIPFEASVTLSSPSGSWTAKLLDISLNGALISVPHNWPNNSDKTFLAHINVAENVLEIKMESTITHATVNKIGLRCDHMDIDSASHLRRLVELNLGSDEILNRELSSLLDQVA